MVLQDPKAVRASTASVCSLCLRRRRANIFSLVSSIGVLGCHVCFFVGILWRSWLSSTRGGKGLLWPVVMWKSDSDVELVVKQYTQGHSCFLARRMWVQLPPRAGLCVLNPMQHVWNHTPTPHIASIQIISNLAPSYNSVSSCLISPAQLLRCFISNAGTVVLIYTPSSTSSLCPHPSFLPCSVSLYYLSQGQNQPVDHSLLSQVLPTKAAAAGFIVMAGRHEQMREEQKEREREKESEGGRERERVN